MALLLAGSTLDVQREKISTPCARQRGGDYFARFEE